MFAIRDFKINSEKRDVRPPMSAQIFLDAEKRVPCILPSV